MFKKVRYEGFEDCPDLLSKVEGSLPVLAEAVGYSAGMVEVSWQRLRTDDARLGVELVVKDFTGGSAKERIGSPLFDHPARLLELFRGVWVRAVSMSDRGPAITHRYDPALKADPSRYSLAVRAAGLLDVQAADTFTPAVADWYLPRPPSQPDAVIDVEIRDETGIVYTKSLLEPEADDAKLRSVMIWWWGDVLALRQRVRMYRSRQSTAEASAV